MKKSIQPNFLFIVFIASNLIAQDFTNPKLDGYAGSAHAPDFWQMIPYTDATCLADSAFGATPDVNDPISYFPIAGNYYSAPTFVSGLHMTNVKSKWHEGIMQTVTGFLPDIPKTEVPPNEKFIVLFLHYADLC